MPGVIDMRPCDANEVAEAWRVLMPIRHESVALVLSRQPLPTLDRERYASAAGVARSGYVLADPPEGEAEVILIATGSEVAMMVDAYERLTADGIRARVVCMPSMELFDKQPRSYRDEVLPPSGHRTGVGGEGLHVRLGPLGGSDRRGHRDAHLRCVGAVEDAAGQIRLHRRAHRGNRISPAQPRARRRCARRPPLRRLMPPSRKLVDPSAQPATDRAARPPDTPRS